MQQRLLSSGLLAIGCAALATSISPLNAQTNRDWPAIEQCAAITVAAQRHACLDSALQAMGMLPRADAQVSAPSSPVQPVGAPRQAMPVTPSQLSEPVPRPVVEPARLAVSTIRSARLIGQSNIEVTADDGSRWRSTSSATFRRTPRSGTPFEVERGAFGGYDCRIEASTYFKCAPIP